MKQLLAILICILFVGLKTNLADSVVLYEQANAAYAEGKYMEAAEMYEQIISEKPSAEIYYNLGNAYYKQNRMAEAILNYERALKIKPGDADIRYNLQLANLQIVDKIEAVPRLKIFEWWDGLVGSCSSCLWSKISLILIWASLLAFAFAFFMVKPLFRKTGMIKGVVFAILSIACFLFANSQKGMAEQQQFGILFTPTAYIKSAPNTAGVDLFILHEGVKMKIVDQVDDWYKIKLADGKEGWVTKASLELV